MLVVVLMVWGLASGVHVKQPHRKIRFAMFLADHQMHPYAIYAEHDQCFGSIACEARVSMARPSIYILL